MSQELHYTSVPRGLQAGSRGFCTVAVTPSLSGPLRERLEGLSGYQQIFPPHDPDAARNPVVFAHHRLNLGGRLSSVLSRVSFAGLDYTERSNKYAHHVVVDPSERPTAGPAWLLSQPGFMDHSWQGEPRLLSSGRPVPQGDHPGGVAHAWETVTGDAGWAGALAESFLAAPGRPAFLVFDPGQDLLSLFVEALALIPPEKRWDVEFNTYFTQLPQGLTCAWRGVVAGTPLAKQAARTPGALVIDLRAALGQAQGGPLVDQARTGLLRLVPDKLIETPDPSEQDRRWQAEAPPEGARLAKPIADEERVPAYDVRLGPPTFRSGSKRSTLVHPTPRSGARTAWWIAGSLAAFGLLGMLSFFMWRGSESTDVIEQATKAVETKRKIAAEVQVGPAAKVDAAKEAVPITAEPNPAPKPEPVPKPSPPPFVGPLSADKTPNAAATSPDPARAAQLDPLPTFIELPKPPASGLGPQIRTEQTYRIPHDVKALELVLEPDNLRATSIDVQGSDPSRRSWAIEVPSAGLSATVKLAQFETAGDRLTFSWNVEEVRKRPEMAEAFLDSLLSVETTSQGRRHIALRALKLPSKAAISLIEPGKKAEGLKPRTLRRPWAESSDLENPKAESWALENSKWDLCIRMCRIDVVDEKSQKLSPGVPKPEPNGGGQNLEIMEGRLWMKIIPDGRFVNATLNFDAKTTKDIKKLESLKAASLTRNAKLKDLMRNHEAHKTEIDDLEAENEELDKMKKELEPVIHVYNLVDHAVKAELSLIMAIRMKDGSFIDIARIGAYADQPK
ncbi:hypothetical protein [Paludisphaera borealis]|uniref:Uncharacterized protein n=1 Tax=Paludisphaera borealis TaxID=1387353 RepID=A0A1U7CMH1_9BACT|nr:hypothetical protein [Paludisphaera borealis]APW60109.1 hypothetical protein BSF38_01573 [Paludisphaera borealis]